MTARIIYRVHLWRIGLWLTSYELENGACSVLPDGEVARIVGTDRNGTYLYPFPSEGGRPLRTLRRAGESMAVGEHLVVHTSRAERR